jgi:hypothetical protein
VLSLLRVIGVVEVKFKELITLAELETLRVES